MQVRTEASGLTSSPESTVISTTPASSPTTGHAVAPVPRSTPRIIALLNQKGGVGKTTTTANLGAALADAGKRVLLIDLDPQAHLTLHVGIDPADLDKSAYDLMTDSDMRAADLVCDVRDNVKLIPGEMSLAGVEAELAPQLVTGRAQRVLKEKMRPLLERVQRPAPVFGPAASREQFGPDIPNPAEQLTPPESPEPPVAPEPAAPPERNTWDYCLIDCPPSLGLLTINALTMASEVLVPMQAHFLALQGLSKLLETVSLVSQSFNPKLWVTGVVLCMHEGQTILASEVVEDLRGFLDAARDTDVPWRDARILEPPIRRNIKLAECPSFGKTIFDYAPGSHGADDYRLLATNL